MTALVPVEVRKMPRIPHDMMIKVPARRLKVGDYLPLQGRVIVAIDVEPGDRLRITSAPPHQPDRRRSHVWAKSTPVMMVPKPD